MPPLGLGVGGGQRLLGGLGLRLSAFGDDERAFGAKGVRFAAQPQQFAAGRHVAVFQRATGQPRDQGADQADRLGLCASVVRQGHRLDQHPLQFRRFGRDHSTGRGGAKRCPPWPAHRIAADARRERPTGRRAAIAHSVGGGGRGGGKGGGVHAVLRQSG